MKSKIKGLAIMAVVLLPLVAAARTVPASIGRAESWSDGSCFVMSYSTMRNACSTEKSFEIPLIVDYAGSKTVTVWAYGADTSNNVGCIAVGVNREFTAFWSSPREWLPAFGSPQPITLTGAYVPNSGYLYANCKVQSGGRVHMADYNH